MDDTKVLEELAKAPLERQLLEDELRHALTSVTLKTGQTVDIVLPAPAEAPASASPAEFRRRSKLLGKVRKAGRKAGQEASREFRKEKVGENLS